MADTEELSLEEMQSKLKSMNEELENASRGRFNDDQTAFSDWQQQDPNQRFQQPIWHGENMPRKKAMPKGYRGAHNPDSQFKSFGHFLKSGMKADSTGEFEKRHASIFKNIEGMSVSSGEDGGFLVPPEYADGILSRVHTNDIFNRCDNYNVATNGMKFRRNAETSRRTGSRNGGLQSYWIGEGQPIPQSHPKFKMVDLYCNKLVVLVYLTSELLEDTSSAAETYVDRIAGDEFNFMLGDAVFNGSGAGQPTGIHKARNRVVVTNGGAATGTITEGIIDRMWERRLLASAGTYEWYHNQDCGAQLDGLAQDVGTGGSVLYRPQGNISTAPFQSIKGARRNETEFNETCGTEGDLTLADLSKYITISNGGIRQESSIHVEFLTDQKALRFIMRVDGKPWEDTPLEPFKGSNLQSATIVCQTR